VFHNEKIIEMLKNSLVPKIFKDKKSSQNFTETPGSAKYLRKIWPFNGEKQQLLQTFKSYIY
jgi:hypothetical protein